MRGQCCDGHAEPAAGPQRLYARHVPPLRSDAARLGRGLQRPGGPDPRRRRARLRSLCPGRIGRYLGLSGVRVGAADALYCRFATHFVPRERVPALIAALIGSGGVEETLAGFAADPGPAPIRARQPAIDRCFAGDMVEAILDALEREATEGGANAEWAAETRAGLMTDRKSVG